MAVSSFEEKRLLALQRFGLLDSPPEEIFDGITLAIANICDVPIALFSLVDFDRQWFKSAYGLDAAETPRDASFCAHAISRPGELMVVEDASLDRRFMSNPLVIKDPRIRFYAGKPIITDDGYPLGTLCVIDRQPRSLLPYQLDTLNALSKTVAAILNERYRLQKTAIDRDSAEEIVRENAVRYQHQYEYANGMYRTMMNELKVPVLIVDKSGTVSSSNAAWTQFADTTGWGQVAVGDNFTDACVHPASPLGDKREEAVVALNQVLMGEVERYSVEYFARASACTMQIATAGQPGTGAIVQHNLTRPDAT